MNSDPVKALFTQPRVWPQDNYANPAEEFKALSAALGSNIFWIQGPGGNAGLKDSDSGLLFVKASGTEMASACASVSGSAAYKPAVCDLDFGFCFSKEKPSIELPLHLLLHRRATAHTHDILAQACMNLPNFAEMIKARFCNDAVLSNLRIEQVDYAMPGSQLATLCCAEPARRADILFLRSHGVIFSASSSFEAVDLHRRSSEAFWDILASACPNFEYEAESFSKALAHMNQDESMASYINKTGAKRYSYAVNPDCALLLTSPDDANKFDRLRQTLRCCAIFLNRIAELVGCPLSPLSENEIRQVSTDPQEIARKTLR